MTSNLIIFRLIRISNPKIVFENALNYSSLNKMYCEGFYLVIEMVYAKK